jgi:hypothetical protein
VDLRPVTEDDLALLERFCVEPELMGLDWQGFRDRGRIRRRFAEDGFLGSKDGQFMVIADDQPAGFVTWRAVSYGSDEHTCWNIGSILLPEWRGGGGSSSTARYSVGSGIPPGAAPSPPRVVPKWYYYFVAMNLRLNDEDSALLRALAEEEGVSLHEAALRAIRRSARELAHTSRVREATGEMLERWGDVLDRLGRA